MADRADDEVFRAAEPQAAPEGSEVAWRGTNPSVASGIRANSAGHPALTRAAALDLTCASADSLTITG